MTCHSEITKTWLVEIVTSTADLWEGADLTVVESEDSMPKTYSPREKGKTLCVYVVQSVVLYTASIWLNAMGNTVHKQRLLRVQRKAVLMIARAYGTASTKALLVLAWTSPIDYLATRGQTSVLQGKCSRETVKKRNLVDW